MSRNTARWFGMIILATALCAVVVILLAPRFGPEGELSSPSNGQILPESRGTPSPNAASTQASVPRIETNTTLAVGVFLDELIRESFSFATYELTDVIRGVATGDVITLSFQSKTKRQPLPKKAILVAVYSERIRQYHAYGQNAASGIIPYDVDALSDMQGMSEKELHSTIAPSPLPVEVAKAVVEGFLTDHGTRLDGFEYKFHREPAGWTVVAQRDRGPGRAKSFPVYVSVSDDGDVLWHEVGH